MPEFEPPEGNPETPEIDARDWGDAGIILYEEGNTGGWIKFNEDDLVDYGR